MKEGLSVHYGEIALKGKLRSRFEKMLIRNITYATNLKPSVSENRLFINEGSSDSIDKLSLIPGVSWVGKYVAMDRKTEDLEKKLKEILGEETLSINMGVKRIDKSFGSTSLELKQKLMKDLSLRYSPTGPKIRIEIMKDSYVLNYDIKHGIGGVPSGSAGKVISLFSGGIDSAVAPFEMMKRGCNVDLVHVYALPDEKNVLNSKITKLVEKISAFSPTRLYMVPFHTFNMKVMSINPRYELVMFKRFLLRLAEELCDSYGYKGIATGDSLSQVASQTLDNINAISYGLNVPVFRPLLSDNKEEIIDKAKLYGTYDLSIEEYKDCCSLVSKKPLTTASQEKVHAFEKELDLDGIIKEGLSKLTVKSFENPA